MKLKSFRPDHLLMALALLLVAPVTATAEGFSVLVAPPRFELKAKPGDVIREHLNINNPGSRPLTFLMRTADWDMSGDGVASFHHTDLQPGSCRPWIRIERHKIRLPAQGKKSYRFEVHVPEDAPPGECRAALLVEAPPEDAVGAQAGSLNLPIKGRIAVIIYLAIGDAAPELQLKDTVLDEYNGLQTPFIEVHNSGNAHGRTTGFVDAVDASGKHLDFEITPLPILPGQTRRVPLFQPVIDEREPQPFTPPLELKGTIEWDGGKEKFTRRVE
jgi:fimbrial chaperone protein